MNSHSKIFVAGHRGMVGSALVRKLREQGFQNLVMASRQDLDLLNQSQVAKFLEENRPEYIFIAAGRVGGIYANEKFCADFLFENLMIETNIIQNSALYDVKKLMFLGSSCVYPKLASQPVREDSLMTGALESTNEGYAMAKIAGVKLCQLFHKQYGKNFISVVPTNIYGPGDNFDPQASHVISGLIRKIHDAKTAGLDEVLLWGTGKPLREFLYIDDVADALLLLMKDYNNAQLINVAGGEEVSITQLAMLIQDIVGFKGKIRFDSSRPDGSPRKILDGSKIALMGWRPSVNLKDGIKRTYQWTLENRVLS